MIHNKDGNEVSEAAVLMAYFGRKSGQSLGDFHAELKALTPEDKHELAIGAAKELGFEVV
jgi:hypothetical protein